MISNKSPAVDGQEQADCQKCSTLVAIDECAVLRDAMAVGCCKVGEIRGFVAVPWAEQHVSALRWRLFDIIALQLDIDLPNYDARHVADR